MNPWLNGNGLCLLLLLAHLLLPVPYGHAGDLTTLAVVDRLPPVEMHGFWELRAGFRTGEDPHAREVSVMEARLQADLLTYTERLEFKFKGDLWADGVTERCEYDTREAWFFIRPADFLDIKIGRQVLTWGTGDLVFLNDLFPKDWQSFFIGRDQEYLKAPSDAVKISFFTELANIDVVYTPKFDPDRYITGAYISFWDANRQRLAGRDGGVVSHKPERWFRDDEIAVRIYRNIHNYELALYAYRGFWKRPGGQTRSGGALFPELNVYGASARGQFGPGIGNIEIAYYHSKDDQSGSHALINNSEMRYLVGYTQDLARDFNASFQYYVEQLMDYGAYRQSLVGASPRDRLRQIITLQLTRLLMNQNLELALSSYYSPSDADAYLRPTILYKVSDTLQLETGANIFRGEKSHTFFGQFENNTNLYTAVRYSF